MASRQIFVNYFPHPSTHQTLPLTAPKAFDYTRQELESRGNGFPEPDGEVWGELTEPLVSDSCLASAHTRGSGRRKPAELWVAREMLPVVTPTG